MKVLHNKLKLCVCMKRTLAIAMILAVVVAGSAIDAFALTLTPLATTGTLTPSNIGIDQSTGDIYVVTGLPSSNVGISKVTGGGIISVYSNIGGSYTCGIAAGNGYLFWGNANSGPYTDSQIFRAPESGLGPITAIYTGSAVGQPIFDISDLAYQSGYLYGGDNAYGRIYRLDTNGNNIQYLGQPPWSGYYEQYISIAVSNDKIFERKDDGIYSFPINGGSPTALATGNFRDLAFYNNMIYAIGGDFDSIWQISASGGPASLLLGGDQFGNLNSIAAFNGSLYLTDDALHTVWQVDLNAPPVPEPATMLLLGSGLIGLAGARRKFKK